MYTMIQRELKRISTWKLVALTVVSSVIITTGLSSLLGYLSWGRISSEVLVIGTIDAIIVPAIVAPLVIKLVKYNIHLAELIPGLQQEITERKRTEAEAQQQAESLLAVSELAIECAAAGPDTPLEAAIADKLVEITNTMAVSLSIYEPDNQILKIRYVAVPAPILATVNKLLRRNIIGLAMPVEPEMLERMLTEVVSVSEDLSEITFGTIPKSVATVIQAMLNIGRITVLALNYGGELVGTIGLVMRADQPPLDPELARTLANIASVSLQRKKAEAALSLTEEKYRSIVDNAVEGIFQSTPEGRFLSVNPAMARMYGYASPDEMIQSVASISEQVYIDPNQRIEVKQRLETENYVQGFEMQDQRRDGTPFWTSMNVRTVRDEQGKTLYYEGMLTDITARKEAEEALRRSEERYRNFIEQSTEGIWMIAFDEPIPLDLPPEEQVRRIQTLGYVAECNNAQARMYGYTSSQEVVGVRLLQHYGDYSEVNFRATLRLVQNGYRSSNRETQEVTASGETVYFLNHAVGVIEQGQLVALWGTQQDITPLKQAEAEREKLIADLEAKNAELERFTYTVSHDLKSPLVTINGFLSWLEKDIQAGKLDRVNADINRIREATSKMHVLLEELLELSRIGRLMNPPERVPFETIVREALAMVGGRLAGRGVTVEVAEDLPIVYGDRIRLVEVVQNLVDNATKFMGAQPKPRVEVGVRKLEGEPIFFVRDNGIGIEQQYLERIYGLFDKLDSRSEGTGIGLALVKRIIEVHGGRIWVESTGAGQGSTFLFTLPFARDEERDSGEQSGTNG